MGSSHRAGHPWSVKKELLQVQLLLTECQQLIEHMEPETGDTTQTLRRVIVNCLNAVDVLAEVMRKN